MQLRVAIVGIAGAVGGELGSQCDVDPEIEGILGVDRQAPRPVPEKCKFAKAQPGAPLDALFVEHGIQLAVYLSPFACGQTPREAGDSPAVASFLAACAAAEVRSLVIASGAWLYDRSGQDMSARIEGAAIEGAAVARERASADERTAPAWPILARWGAADLARERAAALYARAHPSANVCVARLAPVCGPRTRGLIAQMLTQRKVVALAGVEPVLQAVHAEDAALALFKLLKSGRSGAFNVTPEDAVSLGDLSRGLKLQVRRVSPRWAAVTTGVGRFLYLDRLAGVDADLLGLFANRLMLANRKLKRDVGYRFKYATDGALGDHARAIGMTEG